MSRSGRPAVPDRAPQSGQGTVEYTGVVVLVALLLAGLAVAVADMVRAPRAPVDPIGTLREPLGDAPSGGAAPTAPAVPPAAEPPADAPAPLAGREGRWSRFARGAARVARDGSGLVAIAARGFAIGARDRMRERAGEVARDPLSLLPPLEPAWLRPGAVARGAIDDLRRFRRYAGALRRMPLRDATDRLGRDAGRVGFDATEEVAVGRGTRALGRLARRAARPRTPPPEAGAGAPAPSRPQETTP